MARKRTPRGAEKIEAFEPRLAKRILEQLVQRHPELRSEILELATDVANNPDEFSIAAEIEEVINDLDEGDVLKRAGRRRGGYTSEPEAVGEALTEAMEPFFNRLQHQLEMGNDVAALAVCKGIVLAMYRFSKCDIHPLLELYQEYPAETADWAVRLWRTAGDVDKAAVCRFELQRQFPPDFVKLHTPEWEWLLNES
jgi:hypothetical protein